MTATLATTEASDVAALNAEERRQERPALCGPMTRRTPGPRPQPPRPCCSRSRGRTVRQPKAKRENGLRKFAHGTKMRRALTRS